MTQPAAKKEFIENEEDVKFIENLKKTKLYDAFRNYYEKNQPGSNKCIKYEDVDFDKDYLKVEVASRGKNAIEDEKIEMRISYADPVKKINLEYFKVLFPPLITNPRGVKFTSFKEKDGRVKEGAKIHYRLKHLDEKYGKTLVGNPDGDLVGCHDPDSFFSRLYEKIENLINSQGLKLGQNTVKVNFPMGEKSGVPLWWDAEFTVPEKKGAKGKLISATPLLSAGLRYKEEYASKKTPGQKVSFDTSFHLLGAGKDSPIPKDTKGEEMRKYLENKCLLTVLLFDISRVVISKSSFITPRVQDVYYTPLAMPSSKNAGRDSAAPDLEYDGSDDEMDKFMDITPGGGSQNGTPKKVNPEEKLPGERNLPESELEKFINDKN